MKTLAKIHILKQQIQMDDETYRAMLYAQTGKRSAKELTKDEQLKIISYLGAYVNNQDSLANASIEQLHKVICDLLIEQRKHRNYAQAIATRMHSKSLKKLNQGELLQVVDALRKAGE